MILPDHIVLEHAPLFAQRGLRLLGGLPKLIAHFSQSPIDLKPKPNDKDEMMIKQYTFQSQSLRTQNQAKTTTKK